MRAASNVTDRHLAAWRRRVRSFATAGLVAGWLASLWPVSAAQADPLTPEAFLRLGAGVLKVEAARRQGGQALGSGVVIAPERVATNCHVTRDALVIEVAFRGDRYRVEAQAADPVHDVCVLQVRGLPAQAMPIGRAGGLHIGQSLLAVGFTGGIGLQASQGEVIALHPFDGSPVIQSSNWFNSGASGGGLFDAEGRLVGLLTFRMRGAEGHYFAAPVEWLRPFVEPDAAYADVAPLPAEPAPYWQQPADRQPAFLQAAALAQSRRWDELATLASSWTQVSVRNPQPWFVLGQATEAREHWSEAVVAFRRAVALDPRFSGAWLRLGLLYARLGLVDRAREVQRILEPLNAGFAAQVADRL